MPGPGGHGGDGDLGHEVGGGVSVALLVLRQVHRVLPQRLRIQLAEEQT